MNKKRLLATAIVTGVFFASCVKEEKPQLPRGNYDDGILVSNEGAFTGGTGTLNFISNDGTVEEAKVYKNVNNEDLGTIVQSIGFNEDIAYVVANVANKISIANRYTMQKEGEITADLDSPRYIAFADGKGYVTNWGDGGDSTDDYVAVIDLSANSVVQKISVVEGPEQIVYKNNKLYISHKGGWGSGNSISIIDTSSNTVEKNLEVGDIPDELFFNSSGDLVVSCEGKGITNWNPTELLAKIVKIDVNTNEVKSTITFASGIHPDVMVNYNGKIYYSASGKIYEMSENATSLPTSEIIITPTGGMAVNDDKIYITDAKDFISNGTLKIFDLSTKNELEEFIVGLIPRKIYFNISK